MLRLPFLIQINVMYH